MSRRDQPTAIMAVTGQGLMPADRYAEDLLSRHAVGSIVEATLFEKPNPAFLRLLWAIVGDVYPSTEWPTADAMMVYLKTRLRHVDSWMTMAGEIAINPRSLSTFDHQELVDFGTAALGVIGSEIIPGMDVDRLLRARRRTVRSA